jgi:hypothetical protein
LLDDVVILNSTGQQTYESVYGSDSIEIADTIANAPVSANYTLEFVQNEAGNGLRVQEFEAFVPEPAGFWVLCVGAIALLGRRSRYGRMQ